LSSVPNLPPNETRRGIHEVPAREPRRALWKTILRWVIAVIAILVILVAIAIPVLLHNERVHQYVLRTAREKAATALGVPVDIRDFSLAFSGINPTLDVYDVRVHGHAPFTDVPVLELGHARVSVTITSLLRKTWYLNALELHQPVVRVVTDRQGNSNLPQPKKSESKSQTSIFDFGVRHAVLDGGEVYYNNQKSALNADLHDLQLTADYEVSDRAYAGNLSYQNGHIKLDRFNPIPHDFSARFRLTEDRFTLEDAALHSGSSFVKVSGTVDQYATPTMHANARYDAAIDATEFRRLLKNNSLPLGTLALRGTLDYTARPNVPMLNAVALNGTISSRRLELKTPSLATTIDDLSGTYSLVNGDAQLRNLRAQVLGGSLRADATVRDLMGRSQGHLTATLADAQLSAVRTLMPNPAFKQVDLAGVVNAKAEATWGKNLTNLIASADSTIRGAMSPRNANGNVPIDGVIHARYNGAAKEITLANSYVRLPQTALNLNGTVSDRSALQVSLNAQDLHELENIMAIFSPSAKPLGVHGTAALTATVRGTTSNPQINGQLQASNLRVQGSQWRSLKTSFYASPSRASLEGGELIPLKQGRIRFDVSTALDHWKYTPNSPLQVRLNASTLNVADLAQLAGSTMSVKGTLDASADVHGTQQNPIGTANVTLSKAIVAGEPIDQLQLRANGDGDRVNTIASLRLPAGVIDANVTLMPKTRAYIADVRSNGIRLEQLQSVKGRGLQLAGVLNVNATGRGTFDDPGLQATVRVPELRMKGQTISNVALDARVADHVAQFALDSSVLQNPVTARGDIRLTGDYPANITLDTKRIQLQPLAALFAPAQAGNLSGQTELHATLRGPLKRKQEIDAHIVIPVLALDYKNTVQLGAVQPIRIDYTAGVLNIQRTQLRGTGTDMQVQATVPVSGDRPMSLLALGTVDLGIAELLSPGMTSSGQLRFDINSYGSRTDPNVQGRVNILNANVTMPGAPVGLENGNGVLTLTNNRLNITSFTGTVGGGTVTAGGGVAYRPALGFDLALRGQGVRLLVPPGVRAGIGADLALTGTTTSAVLRGNVDMAQLSFTPDFDLNELMGSFGGAISPPPGQGFTSNLQLDLNVISSSGINLVSRDVSVQGTANLRVRGTAAEPVLLGRIVVNGGDLIFRGNRYVLQAGTIDFVNPTRTQPNLNVAITTTIQQYDIAMRFQGPIEKMRTNYTSDPALPPSDIINLLAFGKTSEAAAANPNPPGTLGAQSAIASAVSGQVTSKLAKVAGISHLSVDPTLGGNGQTPGATVTVQQRVTGKIFVTFSTDVTGIQRDVIQLEYQPNRRTRISATRDQNGGFAIDARFTKSW
jgi:translocation and assembly module TamB